MFYNIINKSIQGVILEIERENKKTEQTMDVLASISQAAGSYPTQWSAVYNLNQYSLDLTIDRNYDKVYHFTAEDFRRFQVTHQKMTDRDISLTNVPVGQKFNCSCEIILHRRPEKKYPLCSWLPRRRCSGESSPPPCG